LRVVLRRDALEALPAADGDGRAVATNVRSSAAGCLATMLVARRRHRGEQRSAATIVGEGDDVAADARRAVWGRERVVGGGVTRGGEARGG
jgi:hypothetical protein